MTITTVYTDGYGNYQARCESCGWRGRWCRQERSALKSATGHEHKETKS